MESNLGDCTAENINNIGNLFGIERSGEAESENYNLYLALLCHTPDVVNASRSHTLLFESSLS